jgi:hypothetical protein
MAFTVNFGANQRRNRQGGDELGIALEARQGNLGMFRIKANGWTQFVVCDIEKSSAIPPDQRIHKESGKRIIYGAYFPNLAAAQKGAASVEGTSQMITI